MKDESRWYVVNTYSGYENKVASTLGTTVENRQLKNLIHEICIPTETVVELKDSREVEVERKRFPGYVFIKMILNDNSWYVVRNIRGCTGFVGSTTTPIPLSEDEVNNLGINPRSIEISYSLGDSVRICDGSLQDFVGTVEYIDKDKDLVKIKVSMFGRETSAELKLYQVESIN